MLTWNLFRNKKNVHRHTTDWIETITIWIDINEWMIYLPQTTHMCPMYSFNTAHFFQLYNGTMHTSIYGFHTVVRVRKKLLLNMLENLWTKLVSNRFMKIITNIKRYSIVKIKCYDFALCVHACVCASVCENFKNKNNRIYEIAMISCIFTISFYHWRNDDKQNNSAHT